MTAAGALHAPPRLAFAVLDAAPVEHAAVPTLGFTLRVEADEGVAIRSVMLDAQLQIAARRRAYDDEAAGRLLELFGAKEAWGHTLRTLLWTRAALVVPPFTGATTVRLPVPCTYDLDVLASRYFAAVEDGDVPVELLFSGSVFYAGADGRLQTARLPWAAEAEFRLPVATWKATLERHFAGTAWIRLPAEQLDRLAAYRSRHALGSWEATFDALLAHAGEDPWTR